MKKIFTTSLIFVVCTLLSSICKAQPVTQEWVANYTNPYNLPAGVMDMDIDTDGNIYITGGIDRPDNQNGNFLTVKYNTSGIQQWAVEYNGPGSNSWDVGLAIAVDRFCNVYVTGKSEQTGWLTDAFCTIKYNSSGVQQWVTRYKYTSDGADDPSAIAIDDSGNVYVTGTSDTYGTNRDYLTIKYNPNGDSIWVKRFNGGFSGSNQANSIYVDKSGNVYVTGSAYGGGPLPTNRACTIKYNSHGDPLWSNMVGGSSLSGATKLALDTINNDVYICGDIGNPTTYLLVKYNTNGLQQWVRTYNSGNGDDIAFDLKVDNNHNVYVTGQAYFSNSGEDYLTVKYNNNGDSLWVRRFNLSGNDDYSYSIALDKYNDVYVTGACLDANNNYNFATVKYDTNGIQQWVKTYPGGACKIAVNEQLNVFVTGGSPNPNEIRTIKYSQPDGIIKRSNKIPITYDLFQNYPNPFNSSTVITYDIPVKSFVEIDVFDILGRLVTKLVNTEQNSGSHYFIWNASRFPSGVYFYRLSTGDFTSTKKMLLLK